MTNSNYVAVQGLDANTSLKYTLTSIRYHSSAEHVINEKRAAIEIQFVHSLIDQAGNLGQSATVFVLSILFVPIATEDNPFIQELGLESTTVPR